VCFREDYLLSTKATAALKTAESSTHPLSCKMALGICKTEGKKFRKNNMDNEWVLLQSSTIRSSCLGAVVAARASTIGVESFW
jgi:hypothetical protein